MKLQPPSPSTRIETPLARRRSFASPRPLARTHERNETISRLGSHVSHELTPPTSDIYIYIYIYIRREREREKNKKYNLSEVGGVKPEANPTGKSASFRFRSCVRACGRARRGEAKLRGRVVPWLSRGCPGVVPRSSCRRVVVRLRVDFPSPFSRCCPACQKRVRGVSRVVPSLCGCPLTTRNRAYHTRNRIFLVVRVCPESRF